MHLHGCIGQIFGHKMGTHNLSFSSMKFIQKFTQIKQDFKAKHPRSNNQAHTKTLGHKNKMDLCPYNPIENSNGT